MFFKKFKYNQDNKGLHFLFNGKLINQDDKRNIFNIGLNNGAMINVFESGLK